MGDVQDDAVELEVVFGVADAVQLGWGVALLGGETTIREGLPALAGHAVVPLALAGARRRRNLSRRPLACRRRRRL
jgi:hypothetical protein